MEPRTVAGLAAIVLFASGCRDTNAEDVLAQVTGLDPRPAGSAARGSYARLPANSPWLSGEACKKAVAAGQTLKRAPGTARVASWNIRWFPDGIPGKKAALSGTNLDWTACAIAWLDADVVALQEIKGHKRGREELAKVAAAVSSLTGGQWKTELDRCKKGPIQHVGLMWNAAKVKAGDFQNLGSLNGYGKPCKNSLRPGFAGYFRFPGGLDTHIVSVHMKSGAKKKSYELRRKAIAGLDDAHRQLRSAASDEDVIIAGDFNTMGCPKCATKLDAHGERAELALLLKAATPRYRLVPTATQCSEYFRGKPGLLDHFVVTSAMQELPVGTRGDATGVCGETSCGRFRRNKMPPAYKQLSDHCPIVLDVKDVDTD